MLGIFRILVLGVVAVNLSACGELGFGNWGWNQKLTVVVEVEGRTVSGSSVTSVLWWPNSASTILGSGAAWHSKVRGEAVVVDLGKGKYLFALLSYSGNAEYIEHLATRSLYDTMKRVWGKEPFKRVVNSKKPIPVPQKVYPLLVTFTDINDPKSVEKVDPDNLAATFGVGYRLKNITLEISDEKVTKGRVEKVLEWLETTWPKRLDGQRYRSAKAKQQLANSLSANSFSTEVSER